MTPDIPTGRLPPVVPRRCATRLFPGLVLLVLLAGAAACSASDTPVQAGRAGLGSDDPAGGELFTLAAGESRTWTVELAAGDAYRLRAIPRGLDVELRLVRLAEVPVQLARAQGVRELTEREEIAVVAALPGSHRIEVLAVAGAGRCRLEVDGPRPATAADRRRAEAAAATQQLFDGLRGVEPSPDRAAARAAAEGLLAAWRELGDTGREAALLYARGSDATGRRDYDRAIDDLLDAARLARAAGDQDLAADALNDAGRAVRKRAVTPERADRREASLQEAVALFQQALALYRERGDQGQEAVALSNLAGAFKDLGDMPTNVAYLRESLRLARAAGASETELGTQLNLCSALQDLHEREEALVTCKEALDLAGRLGKHQVVAFNNLATLYESLGEWDQALELNRPALRRARELKNTAEVGRLLYNQGFLYQRSERLPEAQQSFQEALEIAGQVDDDSLAARSRARLALLAVARGQGTEAQAIARRALPHAEGSAADEAMARFALGEALRQTGDLAGARDQLARSRDLYHRWDSSGEAAAALGLARVERAAGDLPAALAQVDAALTLVESLRGRVASPDLRASFLASKQDYYAFKIDTLMALHRRDPAAGHAEAALQANERARARSLFDVLSDAGAELRRGVAPALLERERRASSELATGERQRQSYLQQNPLAGPYLPPAMSRRLESAQEQYRQVQEELFRAAPRYAALTRPQPVQLAEIQRDVLDPDTLLLEYALGTEHSYLWAVTTDSFASWELAGRARIETAATRFHSLLTERKREVAGETASQRKQRLVQADADLERTAAQLSELVLGPVAPRLRPGLRLVVVGDGALQYVPFAALPVPPGAPAAPGDAGSAGGAAGRLIERHQVVVLPSASVLAALRRELALRTPPAGALAVLADPVFHADDRRVRGASAGGPALAAAGRPRGGERFAKLPFAKEEAEAIAKLARGGEVFEALSFRASRATALSGRLADFRRVHFATHGVLDTARPEQSSLVLSLVDEHGAPQDGHLRLRDIYDLKLNADLVVLSACQTALGKEVRGEGLIGLTRGFMHAGAARVVASLWSVEDRATAQLMERFYDGMLTRGLRPAEALREAQLGLARDPRWQAPYFWAAFSLQGEWR